MNIDLENHSFIKGGLSLKNELDLEKNIESMKKETGTVISNLVDRFASYAIKSMPVADGVKDILIDVKNVFKKKDFKNLISTVISSSLREGLEALGTPIKIIKDINKLGEIIKKGGLINGVVASIEIVANKYMKNNILGEYVETFFEKVKDGVKSRDFITKLDGHLAKTEIKKTNFKELCDAWYDAYNKMDNNEINKIANAIATNKVLKGANAKIKSENRIIQNMTKLINNKNEKLSHEQLQLCQIL